MTSKYRPYVRMSLLTSAFLFLLLFAGSATTVNAQTGPELLIPSDVPAFLGDSVTMPVLYTSNGHDIASTTFSVFFDQSCLSFDETDGDGDDIPDAVTFNLPADFNGSVTVDLADTDGEFDFFIADTFPPLASLPDDSFPILEIDFTVIGCAGTTTVVGFSDDPPASFGNTAGASVPGTTTDGSIEIAGPELLMPSDVPAYTSGSVVMPVHYTSNGNNIAATIFSVDFDETCLSFDLTDGDMDENPDAVTFNLPADFEGSVTVDLSDTDGELDFFIADTIPPLPLASLPDLSSMVEIEFGVICEPPLDETFTVPVNFSNDPAASFGSTGGASVPGTTVDGSVEVSPIQPGDCNGDEKVDAGDIPACVLEIFDGDGTSPQDAHLGTFPGTPGCDANEDGMIDAADIICTVLIIFNGPGSCAGPISDTSALPAAELSMADGLTASAEGQVAVPVMLSSNGHALSAATFAVEYDTGKLQLDSSDSDGDGVADAVHVNAPEGFEASVEVDEAAGVVEIMLADLTLPLSTLTDGVLVTLHLDASLAGSHEAARIVFGQAPAASLASPKGQSVPVTTEDGSVVAAPESAENGSQNRLYLPQISQ